MAAWHEAKVVKRIDWNDHLFSLRFSCDDFPLMKAGQFTKIGLLQSEGKVLSRPYSLVNGPDANELEIIAVPVEAGSLSPQLHRLNQGDSIQVMSPATGFLILDEVPTSETLVLLATGTGVGPFLSILQTQQAWKSYANIILVYAVRYCHDLAYLNLIRSWQNTFPDRFHFVPVVSRDKGHKGLVGRIPELINNGSLETHTGLTIEATNCQVMLCGNPDMIKETVETLENKGLKKHLRRSPGQISMERYW